MEDIKILKAKINTKYSSKTQKMGKNTKNSLKNIKNGGDPPTLY